jgi:hypothetical protein
LTQLAILGVPPCTLGPPTNFKTGIQVRYGKMTEPRIICPKCNTSVKLTDSLAAPLIAKTRRQVEQQLAKKEQEFAKREVSLRNSQKAIIRARRTMDAEIAKQLEVERTAIAESEATKARRALGADIEQRDRLLTELRHNLTSNNAKLAEAQQAHADEIGLIVSNVLPTGIETFDCIDNVWITKSRFAIPLAMALRQSLIEVSNSRQAAEGQQTKMEMVYQYLTGPLFRHRINFIVEKFTDMQSDLDRERKTMVRIWAKREEQLKSVLDSSAGLYGDLQGIAGRTLPEIESLGLLTIVDMPGQNAC